MEEDLNDIDIIDKYLNGELNDTEQKQFKERYLNDAEFKKEVEVYRKIYEGIEQAAQSDLKKKLDIYYDEFAQEDLLINSGKDDNIRRLNWWKRAYIIIGIAASVCLFAVAYWYLNSGSNVPRLNAGNKTSTPAKTDHDHKKDTGLNITPQIAHIKKRHKLFPLSDTGQNQVKPYINDKYAFAGQTRLSAAAIRHANYPQPLSYTFNQGLLTIYGDPLLALLRLDVFKKGERYFMTYKDTTKDVTYALQQTKEIKQLQQAAKITSDGGVETTEKIQLQLAPVQTSAYINPPFSVVFSQDKGFNQYYFIKNTTQLVLQGSISANTCKIISLKKDGIDNWYLVSGSNVYALNKSQDKPAPLKELLGSLNPVARLFNKRGPFSKNVLSIK